MRNPFMDAIIAACGEREDIFVVSGDKAKVGLEALKGQQTINEIGQQFSIVNQEIRVQRWAE